MLFGFGKGIERGAALPRRAVFRSHGPFVALLVRAQNFASAQSPVAGKAVRAFHPLGGMLLPLG